MNGRLVIFSIVILALWNVSFKWPAASPVITSVFGESRGDHFHDGIDVISSDDRVVPVGEGKLLYLWNKTLYPLDNYWGGGNYKVITHSDGTLSVYMHLQDSDNLKKDYGENDTVGLIGNTGHSYGKHLHFSLLDIKSRVSMNPLTRLPGYEDTKAPDILYFYIKIDGRYIRINDKSDIRLTKHYPLLVEIRDTVKGNERLGVYRLKGTFNGKEVADYEFSRIDYSSEGLSVKGRNFDGLFDEKGYYMIDNLAYREGENTLHLEVSDFNGNRSVSDFTVNVKLDMK